MAKPVRVGAVNLPRGSLFTEWHTIPPDDAIYFIDRVYNNSKRDFEKACEETWNNL